METVFSELSAVDRALELMRERDLVVLLAADVPAVLDRVRPLR